MTLRIARHAGGRIAYFTLNGGPEMSPFLQKHVAEGGLPAAREPSIHGGDLVIFDGGDRIPVMSAGVGPRDTVGPGGFQHRQRLGGASGGLRPTRAAGDHGAGPARLCVLASGQSGSLQRS
ncbi:hypothetical protein ACRAWD_26635 [Caulobacter segnis]